MPELMQLGTGWRRQSDASDPAVAGHRDSSGPGKTTPDYRGQGARPALFLFILCLIQGTFHGFAATATERAPLLRTNTVSAATTLKMDRVSTTTASTRALPPISKSALVAPALPSDPARLSVFVRESSSWKNAASIGQLAGATVSPRIPTDKPVILASPVTNRMVLEKGRAPLRFAVADPARPTDPYTVFDLESYTDPNPARWDAERGRFETTLRVALFRTNHNALNPLSSPVTLDFAGYEADVEPGEMKFEKLGTFQSLKVTFPRNDVEARINVFPLTEEAPLVVPARRLAVLTSSVSPASILGLGLGTATVTVRRLDQHTNELSEGPSLPVNLVARFARVNSTIEIPSGRSRTEFRVRSVGTAADTFTASSGPLSTIATLEIRPPWGYFAAVLAGGVAGGCARLLKAGRRKLKVARLLGEGCLAGLLASVAVSAGVAYTLLPAAVAESEVGIFLISASVALVGISAVGWLRRLVPVPEANKG